MSAVEDTAPPASDAGVTLIELIMYMIISALIASVIVMMLVNTLRTQSNVTSETTATTRGALVASTLERSMRNALAFSVSADGSTLLVRTSLDNSLVCQGFALSTSSGAKFTQTSTALPASSTWPTWQTGVVAHGATPFISQTLNGVSYSFDLTTNGAPVHFAGTVTARNLTGVTSPCW